MFNNILVVCVGNICRSPTGEGILKTYFPEKNISSAGIATKKSGLVGKSAHETAVVLAKENDIDITSHQAQQLTAELCSKYDLILIMEKQHLEAVTSIAPEARGKTMLFGHWLDSKDIPDPYRQSREAFDHAYKLIEQSALAWVNKLQRHVA